MTLLTPVYDSHCILANMVCSSEPLGRHSLVSVCGMTTASLLTQCEVLSPQDVTPGHSIYDMALH